MKNATIRTTVGEFDPQTRRLPQQALERFAVMSAGVVQQGNHGPPRMPQPVAEELADFLLPETPEVKLIEKPRTLPFRADRDS